MIVINNRYLLLKAVKGAKGFLTECTPVTEKLCTRYDRNSREKKIVNSSIDCESSLINSSCAGVKDNLFIFTNNDRTC